MIIVLKQDAKTEDVTRIEKTIEEKGLSSCFKRRKSNNNGTHWRYNKSRSRIDRS